MADRLMRAQITIPLDSGIPEDSIVNTLYFDADSDLVAAPGIDELDGVESLVTNFYQHFDQLLYGTTIAEVANVKVYDMRDATPRIPIREFSFALAVYNEAPFSTLPSEVALCASFSANVASGENPRRRRGRIYLGPVSSAASEIVNSQSRPKAATRVAIKEAMDTMAEGWNTGAPADSSVKWAVYSPTTDLASSIDDAFNDVAKGFVDDSWDTQRRRGPKPTTRNTFS